MNYYTILKKKIDLYIKSATNLAVNGHFTAVPREGEGTFILTALFDHIWSVWRFRDRLHPPGEKWTRDVGVLPRPVIRFKGTVDICGSDNYGSNG